MKRRSKKVETEPPVHESQEPTEGAPAPLAESGPVAEPRGDSALSRADAMLAAGNAAGALDLYLAASAAAPDEIAGFVGAGAANGALGRYDAAEKELRKALRIAPDHPDVHFQLGLVLFRRGVYSGAVAEMRRVVELEPAHAGAFLLLGEALNQMAQSDQAIEALEQATRIQPNAKAYYAMGIAYDRKGLPDRAAEMYRLSRELTAR